MSSFGKTQVQILLKPRFKYTKTQVQNSKTQVQNRKTQVQNGKTQVFVSLDEMGWDEKTHKKNLDMIIYYRQI